MLAWMKQVREVGYDAEDYIDIFCHYLSNQSSAEHNRGVSKYIHWIINLLRTLKVRNKLATDIKSLKSRVHKVSDRRLRYKLDAWETNSKQDSTLSPSSFVDMDRQLPALHSDKSRIVGMEDKTKKIIGWINEDNVSHLRVISIVGFGGLGKTTLAMTVSTSPDLHDFQCRAFLPVSQTYDLRALLESAMKQFDPTFMWVGGSTSNGSRDRIETLETHELIRKTRDYLKERRYLKQIICIIVQSLIPSS